MKYAIRNKQLCKVDDAIGTEECVVEIIDKVTFQKRVTADTSRLLRMIAGSLKNVQYCKVDMFEKSIAGAFLIPDKSSETSNAVCIKFYIEENRVVFVDDTKATETLLEQLQKAQVMDKKNAVHVLFEFMEFLIHEDMVFLQKFEHEMAEMEERILHGHTEQFNEQILSIRKVLLKFYTYYQQLADMCEILEENANHMLSKEECRLFGLYANRVDRLFDHTQMLKEYSLQVREMYQSQIDIRQNQIMKFLTVVTTIFMPLTLIVGWYGMNFVNMPELKTQYGYFFIIGISVVITLVQIWIFKIKKWF